MLQLAILGAGDLGLSLAQYARDRGDCSIVGFLDDRVPAGNKTAPVPILGAAADAAKLYKTGAFDRVAFAIGYNNFSARERIYQLMRDAGVPAYGVVHPSALVHPTARIAEGVHLFPGTMIDMEVVIEENVVLNTGCIIAHHSIVRAHSYFGPGVRVAGLSEVGRSCFLGIGSTIVEKIKIGAGSTIAAGAVVTGDVAPRSLMAGVPAICKKQL